MSSSVRLHSADAGNCGDLLIRPASPGDRPAILELVRTSLGAEGSPWEDDGYWLWKHERNPFGRSPCLVAEADGRLVAVRAFLRWRWRSGGRDVPAVRAVDVVTHPDFRRLGLFRRLTRELADREEAAGTRFLFTTPNDLSRPGHLKMGMRLVTRVPIWIRPIRPIRMLMTVARSRSGAADGVRSNVRPNIAALLTEPALPSVLERAESDDDRYHTFRTPAYLRWRYAEIPRLSYSAVWHFDDGAGAVAIYRDRERYGLRERMLCELIVTPDRAGAALARRVLSEVAAEGADYIGTCAARRTPERAALVRCGFVPIGARGPYFTCRKLAFAPGLPEIAAWSNWRCSIGDLELF